MAAAFPFKKLSPKPVYFFYEVIFSKRPMSSLHRTARWFKGKINICGPSIVQTRNAKKNRRQDMTRRMAEAGDKKLAKGRKTCNRIFSKCIKAGSQPESQSG